MDLSKMLINIRKKLKCYIYYYITKNKKVARIILDMFNVLFYDAQTLGKTWNNTTWLGIPLFKYPSDLWVYQEILFDIKPDVIIECGTAQGGSALFFAHLCDLLKRGKVITIDITDRERPYHERITYLQGSSTSASTVEEVKKQIKPSDITIVVLDSNHHKDHVLNELKIYKSFVTKGSYMIVEDTILNGNPVLPEYGPGPMEAVEEFLKEEWDFIVDKSKEKFYLTANNKGYLLRIK
jgi:cephalosporin hydroxylase